MNDTQRLQNKTRNDEEQSSKLSRHERAEGPQQLQEPYLWFWTN